jgi:predicted Zn-dependent peptidase
LAQEPAPALDGQPHLRVPRHERLVLDNGVTLTIVPRHDVPLVAFSAVLRGGALGDPPGKAGLAALVAGLLEKGSGSRNAFAFADAVEGAGGSLHVTAGAEHLALSGQFLSRNQQPMLRLLADALLAPHFAAEELEKVRARNIELIKAAKDSDPSELLPAYGRAFLFGDHPYGSPVGGSEASLASILARDVLEYYRAQLGAERLALIFAGDVDARYLKKAVVTALGAWRPAGEQTRQLPAPSRATDRRVLLIDAPGSAQSYFWVAGLGVDKRYPQRAALDLVNALYGGRFTSLLNSELRIRTGLTYGATSSFMRGSVPGEFAIRSSVQTRHTARALELTLGTLARLKSTGVSQEMLDSARAYVLGQYPLSFETAADWAHAFGELEVYGLAPDYIESYHAALAAVTLGDTRRVIAEAFPEPEQMAIVAIADAAQTRRQLAGFGPLTEMPFTLPSFAAPGPAH